jgi:hypothetical protein
MSRAALRRRLDIMIEAIAPRGSRIMISDPLPAGEHKPVLVGTCGECAVYGSAESHSILDAPLPDGYQRSPTGAVMAVAKTGARKVPK